jgi:kinesin family member 18/19
VENQCACVVNVDGPSVTVTDPNEYAVNRVCKTALITHNVFIKHVQNHTFGFDHCYFTNSTQEEIYADLGTPILEKSLSGYNGMLKLPLSCIIVLFSNYNIFQGTIFAYGQTGSGKTHSITGTTDSPGIIPRV